MNPSRPTRHVAVIMRRQPVQGPMRRWQEWRWVLDAVLDNDPAWGTTQAPCWFVMYRMDEHPTGPGEPMPMPCKVSLSYHDAGRWLDAQELVEQVPAPPDAVAWLQAFVDTHHVIEPKRRQRPQSFQSLTDRFGNPASISTGKKRGGGGHG